MPELLLTALRLASGAVLLTLLLVVTHGTASDPTEGSLLRIALRTTAGTMQDCHKLSEQELEALPMHMRRPEVCEARAVPYRLEVHIGERSLLDRTYTAAGIHGDRPLTVNVELPIPPGSEDVTIAFTPTPGEEHHDGDRKAPPEFRFEGPVEFLDGRIRVATLNPGGNGFEIR